MFEGAGFSPAEKLAQMILRTSLSPSPSELVFREMWDTTNISPYVSTAKSAHPGATANLDAASLGHQ